MLSKITIYLAMVLLTAVSMWTTYVSLNDSILPEPKVGIPMGEDFVWQCSVFALALSVAIGLMLFALKVAIVDGEKKLNLLGIAGLIVVAFISISFNMDVLYRTANQDFFRTYSIARMKAPYEEFLTKAEDKLRTERDETLKKIAKQQGELEAEIKGLREAPEGYGSIAKKEDYKLTVLEKTAKVELESLEEALQKVDEAEKVLVGAIPQSVEEIQKQQDEIRVASKDVAAAAGMTLPTVVKLDNPLFAVFSKLFDFSNVGIKEIFFLVIAFFLDLGDIIGYSLIPNKKRARDEDDDYPSHKRRRYAAAYPGPVRDIEFDVSPIPELGHDRGEYDEDEGYGPFEPPEREIDAAEDEPHPPRPIPPRRPIRFKRR